MKNGTSHHRISPQRRIQERHKALAAMRRARLGFWRRMGRNNQLFPRKLVLTTEGKWIIGITLLLGAAAVNTGNNLLYLLLSLAISVIAISGILSELCLRDLAMVRCYPVAVTVGEVTPLRVEVHNDKSRASLHLEVGELSENPLLLTRSGYLLHLAPQERGQALGAVKALRRGPLQSVGMVITTAYPFGFARKSRLHDNPAYILALPTVQDVRLPWRGAPDHGQSTTSPRVGQGESFRGLRDARPGDALRDMHWKVSARRDRLVAREWEAEANRVAVVRFAHVAPGPQADVQTLDPACATVAGLCAALLDAGLAVGLQTFQGAVAPSTDTAGSTETLTMLREHLAQLVLADQPPPPDWAIMDAEWAKLAEACDERMGQVQRGEPLTWAPLAGLGKVEVFLVQFQSRTDVRTTGDADTIVTLDASGALVGMERLADLRAGAA